MQLFPPRLRPALLWLATTTAAAIPAAVAGILALDLLNALVPSSSAIYSRLFPVSFPAISISLGVGSVIGFFQWLILRRYLAHAWLWIPITALAFPISIQAIELLRLQGSDGSVIFVAPVSFAQWLYLRRELPRSSSWVWAHSAMAITSLIAQPFPRSTDCCINLYDILTGSLLFGLYIGVPGAAALLLMFHSPQSSPNGAA